MGKGVGRLLALMGCWACIRWALGLGGWNSARRLEEAGDEGAGHGHEASLNDYGTGVILLALTLGLATKTSIGEVVKLPYTVILLLLGCLFGALYSSVPAMFGEALLNGFESWLSIPSGALQIIFLPVLIFRSAFSADFHTMSAELSQILFLAFPGMLLGVIITASIFHEVLPYQWDWNISLVAASILAATDPVAVVALLSELGVSEKLATLIEGESLFNDGSAIVVFEVFLEAALGETRSAGEIWWFGVRLALGGPALGILFGIVGAYALGHIVNDIESEVTATVILAWGVFTLCSYTAIKVSGVLGVVLLGVTLGYYGKPRVSPSSMGALLGFWDMLDFLANTAIFFVAGLIVTGKAFNADRAIDNEDWGWLVFLYISLYFIRWVVVLFSYPVLQSNGYGIDFKQITVLVHSGLRGAVSLILALTVDAAEEIDQEIRDKILFFTSGIAVMTLLINGTTAGPLVKYFGLDRTTRASDTVFKHANYAIELHMEEEASKLKKDPFLVDADWHSVWRFIPVFTPEVYWRRLCTGNVLLGAQETEDILLINGQKLAPTPRIRDRSASVLSLTSFVEATETTTTGLAQWWKTKRAGWRYVNVPASVRELWHEAHACFKFADGGDDVQGINLREFIKLHAIPADSLTATWDASLSSQNLHAFSVAPHMPPAGTSYIMRDTFGRKPSPNMGPDVSASSMQRGNQIIDDIDEVEAGQMGQMGQGAAGMKDDQEFEPVRVTGGRYTTASTPDKIRPMSMKMFRRMRSEKPSPETSPSRKSSVADESSSVCSKLSQEIEDVFVDSSLDEDELEEARERFLAALLAAYQNLHSIGHMSSSALRLLTDSVHGGCDQVQKGHCINTYEGLKRLDIVHGISRYLSCWPATALLGRHLGHHLSFLLQVRWNFVSAHEDLQIETILNLPAGDTLVEQIRRERQHQLDTAKQVLSRIECSAPLISRAVKTRLASRIMLFRYEHLGKDIARKGFINEKEGEKLEAAATEMIVKLSGYPLREDPPKLSDIMERIEFLYLLKPQDRAALVHKRIVKVEKFVSGISLTKAGIRGVHAGPNKHGKDKLIKRAGWFFLIRGSVTKLSPAHQAMEPSLDEDGSSHDGSDGQGESKDAHRDSVTSEKGNWLGHLSTAASHFSAAKSRAATSFEAGNLYHTGLLFGLTDAMLDQPQHATYTSATYCHVAYFDKDALLKEAEDVPELKRGIWVTVAAHVLRRCPDFDNLSLPDIHRVLGGARFSDRTVKKMSMRPYSRALLLQGHVVDYGERKPKVFAFGQQARLDGALTATAPLLVTNSKDTEEGIELSEDSRVFLLDIDHIDAAEGKAKSERARLMNRKSMKDLGVSVKKEAMMRRERAERYNESGTGERGILRRRRSSLEGSLSHGIGRDPVGSLRAQRRSSWNSAL
ncbi:unnamed protein product [Chrysoparadoxa australica]